ncbi:MAG: formylglycine-generating enzyme family protein [Lacunisphaera sp.]|nr:formylglycine-generating enzyme family protein [Lacunisphaera sp.]
MIWIEPGTFVVRFANDAQQVRISKGFWLGRTEVTQAQWRAVMGSIPSNFQGDDRPVEQVSWNDAIEFCRKLTERERAAGRIPYDLTYTLPTEAQWEYACRAGTTGDYAGNLDVMAWYSANGGNTTHPVGQGQANAWGLHDMHGNVWEWCLDWHGKYPGRSVTDPAGAPSGSNRVHRAGGWWTDAEWCRSAFRNFDSPDKHLNYLGFRLALSSVR